MGLRTKDLFAFIKARELIRLARAAGKPKPWTKDPILQSYRFCNVRREDDTVTQWIKRNWRDPFTGDPNVWFAMVVARLVNWPDTLNGLSAAVMDGGGADRKVKWSHREFVKEMHARKNNGLKAFSGAYIVSTNGRTMDKAEYLAEHVLSPLWEARKKFAPSEIFKDDQPTIVGQLGELFFRLNEFNGMGSFMAAQVVADVKFTAPYLKARDWLTFAESGPGSRRGLNRVAGNDVDQSWSGDSWNRTHSILCEELRPLVERQGWSALSAQDVQNCLCEFDKYERVRLGQGKPRSSYPGAK
jgi:hypothetical protein